MKVTSLSSHHQIGFHDKNGCVEIYIIQSGGRVHKREDLTTLHLKSVNQIGAQLDDLVLLLIVIKH